MKTTVVDFSGIVPPSYDDWWGNKWMRDGWDQCSAQWKQRFDAFVAMHKPTAKVVKVWDCNDNVSPLFAEGWRMAMSFMKGELKNAGVPYTDSGYIFTPGEREKPAAKPEAKPITVSPGAREVAAQMQNTPQPKSGYQQAWDHASNQLHEAKTERDNPEAKPADVPVVDAVWVEDTMADGSKSLTAYSGRESAESCAKLDMERGRARIVRIRTVDEEARFLAHHANERLDQHVNRLAEAHARITALASRLAADKPADKPAARVVKAPGRINASEYAQTHWPISVIPYVENAIALTHLRWREALTSQGIKVEAAE